MKPTSKIRIFRICSYAAWISCVISMLLFSFSWLLEAPGRDYNLSESQRLAYFIAFVVCISTSAAMVLLSFLLGILFTKLQQHAHKRWFRIQKQEEDNVLVAGAAATAAAAANGGDNNTSNAGDNFSAPSMKESNGFNPSDGVAVMDIADMMQKHEQEQQQQQQQQQSTNDDTAIEMMTITISGPEEEDNPKLS